MERSLVSFIIPVLNGEKDIGRCLASIRGQEFPSEEYEIIVVDNGSTDKTRQIVCDYGFNIQVVSGVNVAALRNRGAMIACGEYLAFIDADVELASDWLRQGLVSFKDPKIVASGGPRCIPEEATWVQRTWGVHLDSRRPICRPTLVSWLYSMAFIVRKDKFLTIGGFSEQLETAEDVDLCYRLGQRGMVLYNPAMKAVHWGEDPDLKTFWRKEIWRGKGSVKGLFTHGLRWDELPSVGYPVYILCLFLLLSLSCVLDLQNRQFALTLSSLGLLILPALMLALATMRRAGQPRALPGLFLLYLIYGFARAYSIVNTRAYRRA